MSHPFSARAVVAAAVALCLAGPPALAQRAPAPGPDHAVVLTGFGSVTLVGVEGDKWRSSFLPSFAPILLYQMGENVLVQTELEIALDGNETEIELEYAQVDYLGFNHVILSAGKFLLPFGTFGERRHPSWINKLPSRPLIYGGHGSGGGITPVLTDVGVMARYVKPMTSQWTLNISTYVANGPSQHVDPNEEPEEIPDLVYGGSSMDNNRDKMLGARIGFVQSSGFEVSVSTLRAKWDSNGELGLVGTNVAADYLYDGYELHGEATLMSQQFRSTPGAAMETLKSPGYWVEASKKFGSWEPVIRWSHQMDAKVGDAVHRAGNNQSAIGLDYWIAPSIPVKIAYERNRTTPDRLIMQWAFGF